MENFDCEKFERKLLNLKDTQDSITGLSKWCLNKRAAHKQIVKSWLKTLKEVKVDNRLTLFYLANDVIQHSKRKKYEFVDSWGTSLQRATTLVRDDRVKEKISRIFHIWQQREIYSEEFIADLHGLLNVNQLQAAPTPVKNKLQTSSSSSPTYSQSPVTDKADDFDDDFQLSNVVSSIHNCVTLEAETDKNLKSVVKITTPDLEKIKGSFKDRSHVEEIEQEIENAAIKYDQFISSLNTEIKARKILLTALDQAEKFYRNQRRDVKKVVYAYKNFGDRIKSIQSELNLKVTSLPSPIPSPDINAPSPEPDDFDLPNDSNFYNSSMNGTYGSFLNTDGSLPFDLNEFYRESPPPPIHDKHSIQVIQSQEPSAPLSDFYNSLLPSKIESYNPATAYNDPYLSITQPPLPSVPPPVANQFPQVAQNFICTAPPPPPPTSSQSMHDTSTSLNSNEEYSAWNDWSETPVSPPHFERKGQEDSMVEYIDKGFADIESIDDIDHRQLFNAEIKDIDHRNLISLTGSPGQSIPSNGDEFLSPMMEPPMKNFNFMPGDQNQHQRNQRPPLLPTPRFGRMNSDISKGNDNVEETEMDMDLSDDDVLDNKGPDLREFYNQPPPRFAHLNRPPPMLHDNNDPGRKAWIHNNQDQSDDTADIRAPGMLNVAPPNFPIQHGNRNFRGNFRGQIRGKMIRGGMNGNNSSPFNNNNFKGNRARGRGFRGNFRGSQW